MKYRDPVSFVHPFVCRVRIWINDCDIYANYNDNCTVLTDFGSW